MIDLHNHILPGVDDGAADLDESLQIARQFVSEGVIRVAATPHLDPERGTGIGPPAVQAGVAELQAALDQATIELTVLPGNELYLTPDAPSLVRTGQVSPLGAGSTLLVEISLFADRPPLYLEDTLFHLQLAGYQVVFAHPERYAFVQRDVTSLDQLVTRGVVLQLTAPSLLGEYGASIRRTAVQLLRRGSYATAASDRHHPGPERSLAALHQRITALVDADLADLLLCTNPDRLVAGRPVIQPEVRELAEHRNLFARFFHL